MANNNLQEQTYRKSCPFCQQEHEQALWLNIMCGCGAKYYYPQKTWLNRATGERVVEDAVQD